MKRPIPDPGSGRDFVDTLILGEILTRRGEKGPLARVHGVGPRPVRRPAEPKQTPPKRRRS